MSSTLKVEAVKVLRTERIQDGVERIEFSAGPAAIEAAQEKGLYWKRLQKSSESQ